MPRAVWNGTVIAEAQQTVRVDGNHYFPPESVKMEYLKPTPTQTVCGWKGTANYFTIAVGDQENPDAAWTYPTPKDAAANITKHFAFWKGVQVEE